MVLTFVATAEIDFDEVKPHVDEIECGVLCVVTVEAYAAGYGVVVVVVAAGVSAGVAVDAGAQSEGMDVVDDRAESGGKSLRVCEQTPFAVASTEETVVDIHMIVAGVAESGADHDVSLTHDEAVADVDAVGVPGAPAHGGRFAAVDFSG